MSINAQPFAPTFKLVGNLQQDQVLVFDVSENAFVNTTTGLGGGVALISDAQNLGTGHGIFESIAGSSMQFKSIIAGSNVNIVDNGVALVLNVDVTETVQTGTNVGTGTPVFKQLNVDNQLEFKSIAVGSGLTLADNGSTLTISLNATAGGVLVPSNNLSDLTDDAAARVNLSVYSKADSDAKFFKLDNHNIPSVDNRWDIGSPEKRFNDVYGETFHGTAIRAEELAISGQLGNVLMHNGTKWVASPDFAQKSYVDAQVAAAVSGGNIDLSGYVTDAELSAAIAGVTHPAADWNTLLNKPTLFDGQYSSLTGAIEGLSSDTGTNTLTLKAGWNLIPEADSLQSLGSPTNRFTNIYLDNSTISIGDNSLEADANGTPLWNSEALATRNYVANISTGGSVDLTNYYTKGEVDALIPTTFSGDYNDLINTPAIPSLAGYATQQWVIDQGFMTGDSDNQSLTLTGTVLSISNGNSVDLAAIDTNVDLTNYYTKGEVDGLIPTVFSGDYNDLTNTPSIPETLQDLTNVSNVAPADGQHLVYVASTGLWTPSASSTGSGTGYSDADARAAISGGTGLSYNSTTGVMALNAEIGQLTNVDTAGIQNGQVLKWNGSSFVPANDTVLTSTDQLPEGTTNKWWTDARFDSRFAAKSTSDLAEGTNLYFTDARVDARLATQLVAGTNITITNGAGGVRTISAATTDLSAYATTAYVDSAVFSGVYADLTGKPTLFSGDYNDLTNKPTLFDGAYTSLTGTPTIPADVSDLTDTQNLLGGSTYGDSDVLALNNGGLEHMIPSADVTYDLGSATYRWRDLYLSGNTIHIGDATLSKDADGLKYNGYDLQDFNNLKNKPDLSNLTDTNVNNVNRPVTYAALNTQLEPYITADELTAALAGVTLFSGDYNDLTNKPTIPADISDLTDITGLLGAATVDLTNYYTKGEVDALIPTVFSGDYNDLINKPTIPDVTGFATTTDVANAVANINTFSGSYNDLTDKPTLQNLSAGTGIQINTNTVSLSANIGDLQNVSNTAPTTGQVLKWDGAQWAPGTDNAGTSVSTTLFGLTDTNISSIANDQILTYNTASGQWRNVDLTAHPDYFSSSDFDTAFAAKSVADLGDVDTAGIQTGQFLQWDGTKFVAASVAGGGSVDLTQESINELSDVDTATSAPVNGDVLTWNSTSSKWQPAAAPAGSGGTGASTEYFKLNYATNGALTSITNATSGVSATILSTTGGDVEITFSGYNFPPSNVLIYGYAYQSNEYVIMPLNKDITTRVVAGGGSAGNPVAFGNFGSTTMTLKLREADTGASRSFGTATHAWIVFSMI
jgi:hypothetical protein